MSKYTVHNKDEIKQMLADIGIDSCEQLFDDIPSALKVKELNIGSGKSQMEVESDFNRLAKSNKVYDTVLRGMGAYDHYIPPVVTSLASREEFVTAYTPYQAEISQGILQSIFEYQTVVCQLTGMDVSNASVYDGATAVGEAVNMCADLRKKVLVCDGVNKDILKVVSTYAFAYDLTIEVVKSEDGVCDIKDLQARLDSEVCCVVGQCPNYLGLVEDMTAIGDVARSGNAKFIYVFNPIASVILPSAADCGADIACGEGQPMGMPLSWGGPYLGMLATRQANLRKMVGRIVGQTVDLDGKRSYVLTMQAREQHIRREKATSSICSNEALCALTATIYASAMGRDGMIDVATQCVNKAHYLGQQLTKIEGIEYTYGKEYLYEFTTTVRDADKILQVLEKNNILGGAKLDQHTIVWCVTEKVSRVTLDLVVRLVEEATKCN